MTRWKLVPVEATGEMVAAYQDGCIFLTKREREIDAGALRAAWQDMLSAAPAPDDAVIETAARALDKLDQDECGLGAWDDHKQQVRDYRMQQARAAIAALLGEQGWAA